MISKHTKQLVRSRIKELQKVIKDLEKRVNDETKKILEYEDIKLSLEASLLRYTDELNELKGDIDNA